MWGRELQEGRAQPLPLKAVLIPLGPSLNAPRAHPTDYYAFPRVVVRPDAETPFSLRHLGKRLKDRLYPAFL